MSTPIVLFVRMRPKPGHQKAALGSHFAQPHTRAVSAQFKDWLAEPPAATRLLRLA